MAAAGLPGAAAVPFTAPMPFTGDGLSVREVRTPRTLFRLKLPRQMPPLSVLRACRPSS